MHKGTEAYANTGEHEQKKQRIVKADDEGLLQPGIQVLLEVVIDSLNFLPPLPGRLTNLLYCIALVQDGNDLVELHWQPVLKD